MFLPTLSCLSWAAVIHSTLAQEGSSSSDRTTGRPSRPSSTSSAPPTVHTVRVGNGNFMYNPNTTYAKPGDIVQFFFYPTNHSVTRSEYGYPCIPYELTDPGKKGFYSDHFLVNSFADPPSWNLTINDTAPVFYYCTAIDSCTKEGMVGVINPNNSVSLAAQYDKALEAPYMLEPGQAFPAEGTPVPMLTQSPGVAFAPISVNAPPDPISTTAGVPSAASSTSGGGGGGGSKLSGGAIAGIVIAAIAFVALLAGFFWLLGRLRGQKQASEWGQSQANANINQWRKGTGPSTTTGPSEVAPQDMSQRGTWDGMSSQPSQYPHSPGLVGAGHQSGPSQGGNAPGSPYFPPQSPPPGDIAAGAAGAAGDVEHAKTAGIHEVAGTNIVSELEAPHLKPPDYEPNQGKTQ